MDKFISQTDNSLKKKKRRWKPKGRQVENEIIDLIKKRSTIYSKALYEVKCNNLSKNLIVNRVIELYEKIKSKNK